ncbi:hypothetical protein QDA11_gp02 [Microbacterium phage Jayden]|uniref:Uncharacterized protein n=1 Tax=Microbacterium phage Jayden TaxID=2656550 RepID=A0A649VTG3_9CAUD|nr:hypothetical protein QDA11_gp02 [Microbacterium phage Jayden]QGJ95222.1 hypothetical protein PBI_JAYDEN_2 [Microbacterium phage Jayden]
MSGPGAVPSTPCTLGQGVFGFIPWPGPVVQYVYEGHAVPVWAADVLPSARLTPVRMAEVEESIERMAEQMSRAANMTGESIADALRRVARSIRP